MRATTLSCALLVGLGGGAGEAWGQNWAWHMVDAGGRIPTNASTTMGPAAFTFTVAGAPNPSKRAEVNLDIVHTWTQDLRIELTPPGGAPIRIFDHFGGVPAFHDFDNTFISDVGLAAIGAGPPAAVPPFRGSYTPVASLTFAGAGINPNGVWTMTVSDDEFGDYGRLYRFGDATFESRRASLRGTYLAFNGTSSCGPSACYPNCDSSTFVPCINVHDFVCYLFMFANQDLCANCDGSTVAPVLNVNDFACFLNSFAFGCSAC